jgi:outer membrane lipoprotein-sorting protein
MTANFKVQHENNAALSKISSDFAQFVKYGFRSFRYFYKNPDKVRIESSATLFHFLRGVSVRNGDRKDFYVKSLGIHKTADVSGRQANKKETALDFGVMAGDIWDNYDVWYQRSEHDNGNLVYVLGLKPKNEEHGGTMVVRLDAATLRVLERDRYNGDGEIQQRQLFSNYVHPLPHVWIPTVIKLYNNQGQFGGELDYEKVQVNTSLSDSLFH